MTVHAVLPGTVDTVPSGGNRYDRRVLAGLAELGWDVVEHVLAGAWPRPGPQARQRLGAVLREVPDGGTVLVDGLVGCGVPDVLAPPADRLRLALLVHAPLAEERGLDVAAAGELERAERAALACASVVVTTSRWTAERVAGRHGVDPARVHVAVPGVDPAPVAAGSAVTGAPPQLLCLAALSRTKGQDVLVEALAGLTEQPWTCVLAGPPRGEDGFTAALRARIVARGLTGRVTLPGALTGPALEALWAATDLLVLPSRTETYGMVVTEALARGVPVVASRVGGVEEALGRCAGPHGAPGTWVPAENVAALAGVLGRWLADPAQRSGWRLSALGRRGMLRPWSSTSLQVSRALRSAPVPG